MKYLLLIPFILTSFIGFSQENETNKQPDHEHLLGAGISYAMGEGFTYRYWNHKVGFQATALPYINNQSGVTYVGGCFTPLFLFKEKSINKFYIYNSYHYAYKDHRYDPWATDDYKLDIGLGVGLQQTKDHFSVSVNFGYGGYYLNTDKSIITFSGGIFIFYKF